MVWLAALACSISCSKPKPEIPPGILSRKEMIPILADIHIAQAATATFTTGDTANYSITNYLPFILKNHHVERALYDSSITFYMQHPEIMEEMYDEVINELSKKQGEVSGE